MNNHIFNRLKSSKHTCVMTRRKQTPENETSLTSNHPEVIGILLIILSLITFLSLFSFHLENSQQNWLGFIGHCTALSLLYCFGILSYPLNLILIWIGWRKLSHRPIENVVNKIVHLSVMTLSLCILLSVFAEASPELIKPLSTSLYSENIHLNTPLSYKQSRSYLGGFFSYYLYIDLPVCNLYRLLSNIGVCIVFVTTFLTSLLLMTQFKISDIALYLEKKLNLRDPDKEKENPKSKKWTQFSDHFKSLFTNISFDKFFTRKKPAEKKLGLNLQYPLKEPLAATKYTLPTEEQAAPIPPNPAIIPEPKINLALNQEVVLSGNGRTATVREKAIEQQRVYNGDFKHYKLPDTSLLTQPKRVHQPTLKNDLRNQAQVLEETLLSFGIEAKVGEIHCGPTIVSFEVHPATGVKVQKIKALENDIALNLQAKSIRIIAPIPGKAVVGIEIPAPEAQEVSFKETLEDYKNSSRKFHIPVLLGQTVSGEHVMTDLSRMPHCIIAGATGTGKSVCINAFVMSMLMTCKPDELKLILIDPKKVELSPYTKLPHMLAPVITEPEGVISALKWLVREMENRYEMLKLLGLRNIASFNNREIDETLEESLDMDIPKHMYYIVCIIDELADLMMLSSNEIEVPIARIAQMARAVGIHLVLATQRPSREVITGLIKANFPTRISFKVASRVNSQIILDEIGAESLLGSGDMLFMPPGASSLVRTQGCFVYDQDVHKIVEDICNKAPPNYLITSFDQAEDPFDLSGEGCVKAPLDKNLDPLYAEALDLVLKTGSISTTFLQRKLKVGYARAASIMDQLEEQGIISAQDGSKPRKLLMSRERDEDEYHYEDS